MTIERNEKYTEVVNPNVTDYSLVDVTLREPVVTTAHQTETISGDPYAERRDATRRVQGGIYLIFGILEALLLIRFVLPLLGANPDAGFAQFIYGITEPFIAPFTGLLGMARFETSVIEINPLVAILVYALLAWILAKLVELMMGDSRRGVRTTSSQVDTHVR